MEPPKKGVNPNTAVVLLDILHSILKKIEISKNRVNAEVKVREEQHCSRVRRAVCVMVPVPFKTTMG